MPKMGWMGIAALLMLPLMGGCAAAEGGGSGDVVVIDGGQLVPQAASTAVPLEGEMPPLPDLGPAPEILNETWINADKPVTLASQRGKVVLLEFWTFG